MRAHVLREVATLSTAPDRPGLAPLAFLGCVSLAALIMAWRYVGFQSTDDTGYLIAGLGWLEHFPYVGDSHWTLRHPVTLPIAAAIAVFGLTEFAVSLPAVLYFVGTVAVNIFFASRFIGLLTAVAGTLLMTTFPGFVVLATYMNADLVELFYMTVAFWTFVDAVQHPERRWPLVLSGVAAALGFLTRETSAAFIVFLGLLFLFRPMMPRRNYFIIAAGFVAVIGVEWAYLTIMTGDPLYRVHIDQKHDVIDRAAELAWAQGRGSLIDAEGNVSVNVWLDPFLNLLVTQKYGLLFWMGIPAAVALLLWTRPAPPVRATALQLMVLFAAVWFAFVALNPKLYLVPRYLVVTASFFVMTVGWSLGEIWRGGRRWLAAAVTAAILGASLLGLMVENVNPRFAERQLVELVASHPGETVYTDSNTERHATYFLRFRSLDGSRVSHAMPGPNALVFYNGEAMARCARTFRCDEKLGGYLPKPDWRPIRSIETPRSPIARLVEVLSLQRILPSEIARKITRPLAPIVVYRVPGPPAATR